MHEGARSQEMSDGSRAYDAKIAGVTPADGQTSLSTRATMPAFVASFVDELSALGIDMKHAPCAFCGRDGGEAVVVGIEIDPAIAERAAARTGVPIHCGDLCSANQTRMLTICTRKALAAPDARAID